MCIRVQSSLYAESDPAFFKNVDPDPETLWSVKLAVLDKSMKKLIFKIIFNPTFSRLKLQIYYSNVSMRVL